jgi:hypothetical protein
MKQKIYILGMITVLIIFSGTIFKVNHFPGAGILLTIGLATLVLVFLPAALINNYKEEGNSRNLSLYIVTWLTSFVVFTAMLFKIQHWPHASILLTIALPFPYVVFLPVFLIVTSKNKNFNIYNTVFVLLLMALNSVFSCLLALNVSKARIDDSYNLSRNYIRLETILKQLPARHQQSSVNLKLNEVLKIVNEYQDLILKQEGLSREQWNNNPGNLLRPEARGVAANALLKDNESFPGEKLQTGLKSLILEFEKSPGYEGLAKSAPLIFDYREAGYNGDPWAIQIFTFNPLSWALIYLDGLEVIIFSIKESIPASY